MSSGCKLEKRRLVAELRKLGKIKGYLTYSRRLLRWPSFCRMGPLLPHWLAGLGGIGGKFKRVDLGLENKAIVLVVCVFRFE